MTVKRQKKIVCANLDKITNASKKIAKDYGVKHIPLATLKVIIEKSIVDENTNIEALDTHNKAYNKTLWTLYDTCISQASKMDSKNVPVYFIEKCIKMVKSVYIKS